MSVKHLFVALASIAAIVATNETASAQVVASPKFQGGGAGGYRGAFPGFNPGVKSQPTNLQQAAPTAIYGVASALEIRNHESIGVETLVTVPYENRS